MLEHQTKQRWQGRRDRLSWSGCFVGIAIGLLSTAACEAGQPVSFWQSPVVTHTNGMRLASTTSLRSHNAYWQCDPGHSGYCNGKVRRPMLDELSSDRGDCGYRLPYGTQARPVGNGAYHSALMGVEQIDCERIGSIPNGSLTAGGFSVGSSPVAPSQGR